MKIINKGKITRALFKRRSKNQNNKYIKYFLKAFTILCLLTLYVNTKKYNDNIKNNKENKEKYFTCFASMVKMENRYIRESVEHYLKIGVEKFYFGEDNELNGEKIADVLQDYIDKGIVEVKQVRDLNWINEDYFEFLLKRLKGVCEWIIYFDVDEFLEFKNKSMTIKDYLTLDGFNKCDLIKIHWLVYCDNDLVHYENKPLEERFTKPDYYNGDNNFHKSILRVKDYNITMWDYSCHQPNETFTYSCDAAGRYYKMPKPNILGTPNYKYCYLKHYSMKTAEEYLTKILKGKHQGLEYDANEKNQKIDKFFSCNKVTEEKLSIFEKGLNMTFPKYHDRIIKDNK